MYYPSIFHVSCHMTKKKGFQEKNIVHENSIHVTQTEVTQQSESTESYELQDEEAKSCYPFVSVTERSSFFIMDKKFDLKVQDSESSTGSIMCESFEIDQNGNQDVGISDNLASENDDYYDDEEDSLIEIDLPRSFFSDLTEEPKQKFESKLPDFLPGSIFMEQGLMELLDEIIEDENLIEIDISMGSKNTEDYRLKKEFASLEDQCVLSE
ncbi:hypothetical protein Lal_00021007 [Lupinus albus]|uniref:Uncharacterized protein n=1 Tax=Lupinus albus TaxID=3870 RepID=A0A6A4P1C3_LUPAL|nr:hypothetical protein Lalb_Chr15g0082031 [Lupinus albus]KAF1894715.1 hypothetical protein Lal_00021007 [Lupinus albus]